MSKAKPTIVAGIEFKKQEDLKEYCKKILNKEGELTNEEQNFLHHLIKRHPDRIEKIGCGIKQFFIGRDRFNGKCFYILRTDGYYCNFSYQACISPPSYATKINKALRHIVAYQTFAFKVAWIETHKTIYCAISGDIIDDRNEIAVDHNNPQFVDLVKLFLDEQKININDIKLLPHKDEDEKDELEDKALEAAWEEFHKQHANLQIVKSEANQRKPRK